MISIIIVHWLGSDRPLRLHFLSCPFSFSIFTPLFLPSVSVSLSYFIIAVPVREDLGKLVPFALLNGTSFFPTVQLQVHNMYSKRKSRNT